MCKLYIQDYRDGARHRGQVDWYRYHWCRHMVWNVWLHAKRSVPQSNPTWQILHMSASGSVSAGVGETACRVAKSIVMVCAIFRCQKTGHSDEMWSCKKRVKRGFDGFCFIHSFNLFDIESTDTVGGAQISMSIDDYTFHYIQSFFCQWQKV